MKTRRRAVDLLNAAWDQRIIVLAGPGVLHAQGIEALRAERFDIRGCDTLSGKGLILESHRLARGVFG
jgi:thiamine pyrophosphate-dependent acetolactate synthase large subunit-like protein